MLTFHQGYPVLGYLSKTANDATDQYVRKWPSVPSFIQALAIHISSNPKSLQPPSGSCTLHSSCTPAVLHTNLPVGPGPAVLPFASFQHSLRSVQTASRLHRALTLTQPGTLLLDTVTPPPASCISYKSREKMKILIQTCKSLEDLQMRRAKRVLSVMILLAGRNPRDMWQTQNTQGEINSKKISFGSNPISYRH